MSRTLLVYDDDPDILALVARVAESAGYDTCGTQTNDQFWTCYDDCVPTAIVLDLVVPEVSGIDVLIELGNRGCNAPILVMSGYHREVLNSARRLGGTYGLDVRDIIPKPFDIADLKAKLEEIG